MAKLTTTTQGMMTTLFKASPDTLVNLEWEHFRIDFQSKFKYDRDLKPICFKHSVGNVELIVYSSCVPEFLDISAVRKNDGLEMPYYTMGSRGFFFDYKGKNHTLGNVGAVCVVIKQADYITYCRPLQYVGHIAQRLKGNPENKRSVPNRFVALLEDAWEVALPLFQKEQKRLAKRKVA